MMRRAARGAVVVAVLSIVGACAARAVPTVVGAPRHPDFVFPVASDTAPAAYVDRLQRGWQFLQADDVRNAEREFTAALKQQPEDVAADTALGYTLLARRRADDALDRFDRALARSAAYVPALVGRGYALVDLKREGDAASSFDAAIAADPSLTDLQGRVAMLRFRSAQDVLARAQKAAEAGRTDEARQAYQQAIGASPDSAFLYRELAQVERQAGAAPLALEHVQKAIGLDPADARAHAVLGELLEAQGDLPGAVAAYEQARNLDPDAVPVRAFERARERAATLAMPAQYQAIPQATTVTRADVAALLGIRLEALVATLKPRQVVIADVRGQWAQRWITAVVRSGLMDTLPNYAFEPSAVVRRGELARTVSRVLTLIGSQRPGEAATWQQARVAVSDVDPAHLSYPAVSMAVAASVMALENGTFQLLRPVSGAELVAVVGRLEALARP